MITSWALSIACTLTAAPSGASPSPSNDSLAALYETGKSWPQFLAAAKANRELWKGNFARGASSPAIVARAKAVPGMWKVLIVAEDWCNDSANTIPYLARLVEDLPAMEIRIVNSTDGKWVMEQHKTPDGRAATPTVLLLAPDFTERGCFVERPAMLAALVSGWKAKLSESAWHDKKAAWYTADSGKETVAEFVAMLEGAATGAPKCSATR